MKDCKGRDCDLGANCFKLDPDAESCTCGYRASVQVTKLQAGCAAMRDKVVEALRWIRTDSMPSDLALARSYLDQALSLHAGARLLAELEALRAVAEAARKASAEIQAQKTVWPGEVDTLADAIAALDSLEGRK